MECKIEGSANATENVHEKQKPSAPVTESKISLKTSE